MYKLKNATVIIGLIIIGISIITITLIANNAHQRVLTRYASGSSLNETQESSKSQESIVQIPFGAGRPSFKSVFFDPPRINIHHGNVVTWINADAVSHTVTSNSFNSGLIWPANSIYGSSNFKTVFSKAGTFSYFCQIHPYMSGIVYVDTEETERVLKDPVTNSLTVKVEMPQNTAYLSKYGPYYVPSYAIVPSGSKVTWTNKDYIPHTATSTDGSFDTGPIKPGQSKTVNIIHNSGTVAYYCEIHPWMQATIQVESKSLSMRST